MSAIENHKSGDVTAGIAKRSIIPKHINAVAIHKGKEPRNKVDEANLPKGDLEKNQQNVEAIELTQG